MTCLLGFRHSKIWSGSAPRTSSLTGCSLTFLVRWRQFTEAFCEVTNPMTYSMTADRYASMAVLTLRTLFSVLAVMLLSLSASNAVLASAVPDLDLQRYEGKVVI